MQSISGTRLARLGIGLVLFGVSIAVMLTAGLGVDSWDAFHQGVAKRTGISFGWVINGVSVAVLLLWLPLRQRPGLGTLLNAIVVGLVADVTMDLITTPRGLPARVVVLILGIVSNGAATGLYIGAGLGPGPRDGLMTGLAARTGRTIRSVRTAIEVVILGAAWALGGPIGLGTLLYAVFIGPLSQLFLSMFTIEQTTYPSIEPTRFVEACR